MLYSCVPLHFACTSAGPRARASARGSLCRSGRGATPPPGGECDSKVSSTKGRARGRASQFTGFAVSRVGHFARVSGPPGGLELGPGGPPGRPGPRRRVPAARDPAEPPRAQEMGPGRPTYPAPGGPRHDRPFRLPGYHLPGVRGGPPRRPAGAASPTLPRLPAEAGPPGAGRREHGLPGRAVGLVRVQATGGGCPAGARTAPGPGPLAARPGHRPHGQPDAGGLGGAGPGGGVEARRVAGEPGPAGRTRGPGSPWTASSRWRPRAPGGSCLPRVHPAGPPGPRGQCGRADRLAGRRPGVDAGRHPGTGCSPLATVPSRALRARLRRLWPMAATAIRGRVQA